MKLLTGALVAMLAGLTVPDAQLPTRMFPLQGTWTLVAADKVLPDGMTTRDYGENPKGRLVVDENGRYSLQIFKSERLRFASDSKSDGSVDELRSAVMGSSTHYGTIAIDVVERTPVAVVPQGRRYVLVDRHGVAFHTVSAKPG